MLIVVSISFSQTDNSNIRSGAPNVFIDCSRCDKDFIRKEVTFVNYVWDRNNADVHILFSKQKTGGGGKKYTLSFIGGKDFLGLNDTLSFVQNESDSDDDARKKMVQTIKLGLIKYVSRTPIASKINISFKTPKKGKDSIVKDEWDYWVFRTRLRGFTNGEKSRSFLNLFGSVSANRVTENLKVKISLHGSYNESSFNYSGSDIVSISRYQGLFVSVIKSYNDHFSYGLFTRSYGSIYDNLNYALAIAPGIEYNIFPYSESTSRQLRIGYKLFAGFNNYNEETIYLKDKEFLGSEKLSVTLELVQPWGTMEAEISGAHYFHDFKLNSITLYNEFRINVMKGLTIDLHGRLSFIHDQIALPKGGVDLEEVLLQRKQLETSYEYFASFGFTYSFGSIYNNIVNPRFGD
jgi:hypothetical protein